MCCAGNSLAGIRHRKLDDRLRAGLAQGRDARRKRHASAARRVFDRVVEQVEQHLVQAVMIAGQAPAVGALDFQLHALALGRLAHQLDGFFEQAPDVQLLELHRCQSAFEVGKRNQVVDQPGQAMRLAFDDPQETPLSVGIVNPVQQRFGIAAQGAQRGADLVGQIGDKVGTQAFVGLELGDIVKQQHPGGRGPREGAPTAPAVTRRRRSAPDLWIDELDTLGPFDCVLCRRGRQPIAGRPGRGRSRPGCGRGNRPPGPSSSISRATPLISITSPWASVTTTPSDMLRKIASSSSRCSARVSTSRTIVSAAATRRCSDEPTR